MKSGALASRQAAHPVKNVQYLAAMVGNPGREIAPPPKEPHVGTVRVELDLNAHPDRVWQVIGSFAAGPQQMAPDFVTDCRVDGDVRTVFFADGAVSQERLVAVDDQRAADCLRDRGRLA